MPHHESRAPMAPSGVLFAGPDDKINGRERSRPQRACERSPVYFLCRFAHHFFHRLKHLSPAIVAEQDRQMKLFETSGLFLDSVDSTIQFCVPQNSVPRTDEPDRNLVFFHLIEESRGRDLPGQEMCKKRNFRTRTFRKIILGRGPECDPWNAIDRTPPGISPGNFPRLSRVRCSRQCPAASPTSGCRRE